MGFFRDIFKRKNRPNDIDALDFENPDSILSIVVQLYKEAWAKSNKWEQNHSKIEKHLTGLLSENPNDTRALINLGAILSDNGKHKDALTELLKAEKLQSEDANLYKNIGIAKMNIESERQNAKEYFAIANKLEPDKLTIEAYFDPQGH